MLICARMLMSVLKDVSFIRPSKRLIENRSFVYGLCGHGLPAHFLLSSFSVLRLNTAMNANHRLLEHRQHLECPVGHPLSRIAAVFSAVSRLLRYRWTQKP
jgi:hypothetical protein